MENKICKVCLITKPLSEFNNSKDGKYGKKSFCILCDKQIKKEYYLLNREKILKKSKEYHKKNYVSVPRPIENLVGLKFGRLEVIEYLCVIPKKGSLWKCKCECGNIKIIHRKDLTKKSSPTKSCGCLVIDTVRNRMTGKNNYGWKGGKPRLDSNGYLEYRHGELRGIKAHRHVYEEHYGIKLKPHQNIHHINGIRTDNRIENLELWDTSQPSGQRVEDKINYYFELVQQYKDHPQYKHMFSPKHDPPF